MGCGCGIKLSLEGSPCATAIITETYRVLITSNAAHAACGCHHSGLFWLLWAKKPWLTHCLVHLCGFGLSGE